jgi:hypothetical protein
MSSNSLLFFREFRGEIRARSLTSCGKSELSADYTAERHALPGYSSL